MTPPVTLKPGERHPSWPWYLRAGMIAHLNYPDSDKPMGRIVGHVAEGEHRAGQPVMLDPEIVPEDGVGYDFTVTHTMFLLPCPFEKRKQSERILNEWCEEGVLTWKE